MTELTADIQTLPMMVEFSDEMIRKEHIKHEASVQSVGVLYYIGGVFGFLAGITAFMRGISEGNTGDIVLGLIFIFVSVCQFIVGWGLRRLLGWARIPTIMLSSIGLIGFPIGTLVNGYILYLVVCAKGKVVFSEEYRAVIDATPNIKYKSSMIVWILLGILVLLIVLGLLAALFAG